MVGHGGSSAGSYLTDPISPIPSHCASIVVTSTVRVKAARKAIWTFKPFKKHLLENDYTEWPVILTITNPV